LYELRQLDIDDPSWIDFVAGRSEATPFHHPAWAQLLADCYSFRAFALVLSTDEGIVGGLPTIELRSRLGRNWISLPFTDHCEPLASSSAAHNELELHLQNAIDEFGVDSVDLAARVDTNGAILHAAGVLHRLAVEPNAERVFARFSKMRTRAIRKAQRGSVTLRLASCSADVDTVFYRLHEQTRRRLGVPVQPRRFFRLLWRRIVEPGLGSVLIAEVAHVPVASAVFFSWNRTTIYKYGGSDPAAWSHRPNDLLFAEAIRSSCQQGDHTFDFGRSEVGAEGLRAFKAAWAAQEEPLFYSSFGAARRRALLTEMARLAEPVIRLAPTSFARLLGTVFYARAARSAFTSPPPSAQAQHALPQDEDPPA
jgi:CelD/BcsL family acetyltransferase involved in cellulose biosynthesis